MVSKVIRLDHLLWITVLIVRVGCIIEAYASPSDVDLLHSAYKDMSGEVSGGAPPGRQNSVKRKYSTTAKRLFRNNPGFSASAEGVESSSESNEDSCTNKADGYFANYGSDCTSYYFCAAGYQITYVCPPDMRFNEQSKKCEDDVKCNSKSGKNPCDKKSNGYYSKKAYSPKYFYCHNNAKVIDLVCDSGKFWDGGKCAHYVANPVGPGEDQAQSDSCEGKSNGFFPVQDLSNSDCSKYYYCIAGEKTELRCDAGLVFNGDICVHSTRFTCVKKHARLVKFDDDALYHLSTDISHGATENILVQNDLKANVGRVGLTTEVSSSVSSVPE